jgi:hypothetical protein
MAFWDTASIYSNRHDASLLRTQSDATSTSVSYPEPEVAHKWHPGATLAFIVVTCSLLWGGIFAALSLFF